MFLLFLLEVFSGFMLVFAGASITSSKDCCFGLFWKQDCPHMSNLCGRCYVGGIILHWLSGFLVRNDDLWTNLHHMIMYNLYKTSTWQFIYLGFINIPLNRTVSLLFMKLRWSHRPRQSYLPEQAPGLLSSRWRHERLKIRSRIRPETRWWNPARNPNWVLSLFRISVSKAWKRNTHLDATFFQTNEWRILFLIQSLFVIPCWELRILEPTVKLTS